MNFNPALYVRKTPSGELELPLFARIMWLNAERPGWRITSEKFSVIAVEVPEGKSISTRYIATGHVSVVDEQGRKVLSVPASAEVDSPFFAEDLFRAGAELALDILGFHVRNIPSEYWQAVSFSEPEPIKHNKKKEEPVPVKEDILEDRFDEHRSDKPVEPEGVDDDVVQMFRRVLSENPAALGFGKNDMKEDTVSLLNKYCYKITGLPWNLAQEEERRAVRECLEKLL